MGTVAHEIGHAVGFWHEQARPDRDDYVTVLMKNVIPDRRYNFQKSNWGEVMSYGVPYDVGSLMHYGSKVCGFLCFMVWFIQNYSLTVFCAS